MYKRPLFLIKIYLSCRYAGETCLCPSQATLFFLPWGLVLKISVSRSQEITSKTYPVFLGLQALNWKYLLKDFKAFFGIFSCNLLFKTSDKYLIFRTMSKKYYSKNITISVFQKVRKRSMNSSRDGFDRYVKIKRRRLFFILREWWYLKNTGMIFRILWKVNQKVARHI